MGTSAVGRTGSNRVYKYPDTQGGGASSGGFARNYATGSPTPATIALTGTTLIWTEIASGPTLTDEVPITPAVTGIIHIEGVVCVKSNIDDAETDIQLIVLVDGAPLDFPVVERQTVLREGYAAIPFCLDTDALSLGLHTVTIAFSSSNDGGCDLVSNSCSIELQEVSLPTG